MQEDPLYHVEPYEYVPETLKKLRDCGCKLAVFSNKPHLSAVNVVETILGKNTFDHIQGQTDRIPIKPDPTGVFESWTDSVFPRRNACTSGIPTRI